MRDSAARIRVKVTPGASRSEIVGRQGEAWRIRVTDAPERGRANDAALGLLAQTLALPRRNLTVVAGHTGREKIVAADGISPAEVESKMRKVAR